MCAVLAASERYYAAHGEPLFSSHMLDLSEDPLEENIATCVEYLERMSKSNLLLEMELGITGGEEDGVDNSDVDSSKLYTQPEEVWQVYEALSKVPNGKFTVAAAFGNVHGVYSPGNVRLEPQILHNTQKFISEKLGGDDKKPVYFVFHGGSGSSTEDIQYAIEAGTIKMNIDTDTQWSFWVRGPRRDYISTFAGRTFVQHTGRHPRVRGQEPRLPPAADRQPRRRGQAEQEVLRPAHVPALGGGGDGRAAGQGHGGPEVRERVVGTYKTAHCSLPS